jgi:hypothetical protein
VLFDSSGISCEGQINYSEIGMTADQTKECKVSYPASGPPPSVDSDIAACNALTDQARTDCWVNFDKKLMEEIVPWVPYRWANALTVVGTTVTKYEFDQFSGVISLAHIAVDNGVGFVGTFPIIDRDSGAGFGERHGNRGSDATGRAGHQRGVAVQIRLDGHDRSPCWSRRRLPI